MEQGQEGIKGALDLRCTAGLNTGEEVKKERLVRLTGRVREKVWTQEVKGALGLCVKEVGMDGSTWFMIQSRVEVTVRMESCLFLFCLVEVGVLHL